MDLCFPNLFGASFPVSVIDGMGAVAESGKSIGFSYVNEFVLDPSRKSHVVLSQECRFSPFDTRSQTVEVYIVSSNPLVITHPESLEFSFGISFRVVRSEVDSKFGQEFGVAVEPVRLVFGGKAGFEPIECGSF